MLYPGGKGKTFQHIINVLPPHSTYIETHLGGGAVLRHKRPAKKSIGIDVDQTLIEWWRSAHPRLAQYYCIDAVEFLQKYCYSGSELVYCDPPYLSSTRKRKRVYKCDYSEADHLRLLNVLRVLPCFVVISGYPSLLYERELVGWSSLCFTSKAHDGIRSEQLWFNFRKPEQLHDPTYLGTTFRERQTIKRRMQRTCRRLACLTRTEQHEVLAFLLEELKVEGGH